MTRPITSQEIRKAFLGFFVRNGHLVMPSSSLVPEGDPTLLFTSAGMVQFKPYFSGQETPTHRRLASSQKCFRTTDIDRVGDESHLTFFEMLGNFSIGDYFKEGAIELAWEFVTHDLALSPDRLWITIYLDDDEAQDLWMKIGVPEARILRFGKSENWWGPAGKTGPCGPDSEIFYDRGEEHGCGRPDCAPNCPSCDRYLELWNLVFMQYHQDEAGELTPLPEQNIDTGMGLERTAVVMQGASSIYETDLFYPLVKRAAQLVGVEYGSHEASDRSLRIIAEHGRAATFLITDGVMPANEGRGYVLRRVLRKAIYHGRHLGRERPFLGEIAGVVGDLMGEAYPELIDRAGFVVQVMTAEEERFGLTLDSGLQMIQRDISRLEEARRAIDRPLLEVFKRISEESERLQEAMKETAALEQSRAQELAQTFSKTYELTSEQLKEAQRALGRASEVAIAKPLEEFMRIYAELTSERLQEAIRTALERSRAEELAAAFREVDQQLTSEQLKEFERALHRIHQELAIISGRAVFRLYDTYGLPPDFTREIAAERGIDIDEEGFEAAMAEQQERARAAARFVLGSQNEIYQRLDLPPTKFIGYESLKTLEDSSRVLTLVQGGEAVDEVQAGDEVEVVLDITPFYAEAGGQIADTGVLFGSEGRIRVEDAQSPLVGLIVHYCRVEAGSLSVGDQVTAVVDEERRLDIIRNHTATHLLHKALREVLGGHARQSGSLVAPDRLRFDFTHMAALTPEELREIERGVNAKIRENLPVTAQVIDYDKAIAAGAVAIFGEKYGDRVRMVSIDDHTKELCGGTHLRATGEIGLFHMVGEESIGAGLRRIEALTGRRAERYMQEALTTLVHVADRLQVQPTEVGDKVASLLESLKEKEREVAHLRREKARNEVDSLLEKVTEVKGVKLLAAEVRADDIESLREMTDWVRDRLGSVVVVLGAVLDGKPSFVAAVTPDLVERGLRADWLVKEVANLVGGGGGGRATLAQAGGRDASKLQEALAAVEGFLADRL